MNCEIHWCFSNRGQSTDRQPLHCTPLDQRISWSSDVVKQSCALLSLMRNRAYIRMNESYSNTDRRTNLHHSHEHNRNDICRSERSVEGQQIILKCHGKPISGRLAILSRIITFNFLVVEAQETETHVKLYILHDWVLKWPLRNRKMTFQILSGWEQDQGKCHIVGNGDITSNCWMPELATNI